MPTHHDTPIGRSGLCCQQRTHQQPQHRIGKEVGPILRHVVSDDEHHRGHARAGETVSVLRSRRRRALAVVDAVQVQRRRGDRRLQGQRRLDVCS